MFTRDREKKHGAYQEPRGRRSAMDPSYLPAIEEVTLFGVKSGFGGKRGARSNSVGRKGKKMRDGVPARGPIGVSLKQTKVHNFNGEKNRSAGLNPQGHPASQPTPRARIVTQVKA